MVKAMIDITPEANHILNIIKAKHNLKDKSEAIVRITLDYGLEFLEPELQPNFIKKIKKLEKEGKFLEFDSIEKLKASIENA
jgi:hypothetical protein